MDAGSKQSTPHSFPDDYSVSRGTEEDDFSDSQDVDEEDSNAIILDPSNSERYYWRDIITKVEREIWRPGELGICQLRERKILISVQVTGMAIVPQTITTRPTRPRA